MNLHLEWSLHCSTWALFCSSFCWALRIVSNKRSSLWICASGNIYWSLLFVIFEDIWFLLMVKLIDLIASYGLKSLSSLSSFSYYVGHINVINIFFILSFLWPFIAAWFLCGLLLIILSYIIANALELATFIDHTNLTWGLLDESDVLGMWTTGSLNNLRHISIIIGIQNRWRYVLKPS